MRPGEQHTHRSAADTAKPHEHQSTNEGMKFEAVPDVSDEAYLRANKPARSFEFAELYARVGSHILTIQMDVAGRKNQRIDETRARRAREVYAARLRER
jgi:hypothetical protein